MCPAPPPPDAPLPAPDDAPLVVTLALDAGTQAWLDALRRTHFPPERLVVGAHVTLFHALPGARRPEVQAVLADVAAAMPPFEVMFAAWRSLGRGVAADVESAALVALRGGIARAFAGALTRQDAQGYRPHATVQNKVEPDVARATLAHLVATETLPRTGHAEGLDLWRYRGGPWEAVAHYGFGGAGGRPSAPSPPRPDAA